MTLCHTIFFKFEENVAIDILIPIQYLKNFCYVSS